MKKVVLLTFFFYFFILFVKGRKSKKNILFNFTFKYLKIDSMNILFYNKLFYVNT